MDKTKLTAHRMCMDSLTLEIELDDLNSSDFSPLPPFISLIKVLNLRVCLD